MFPRRMMLTIACVVAFGSGATAAPPPPYLVKNVNPGSTGSQAFPLFDLDGTLFFSANRTEFGKELWKSDGTKHGTVMVKDIYPGIASVQDGIPYGNWSLPGGFTNVAGTLFFGAQTAETGGELWKSDGTEAGTVLVKDMTPGPDGSSFSSLAAAGSLLFFTSLGHLWVSDGTDAGTTRLTGLHIGVPPYNGGRPRPVGTTVFFAAADIFTGLDRELWKTDGTEAGTSLVKTFGSGIDMNMDVASAFGSLLLFSVCDTSFRCQLWRSDGTDIGTFALTSITPGPSTGPATSPVDAGALAFFLAREDATGQELWKTDGTVLGTSLVTELVAGAGDAQIHNLIARGSDAFFLVTEYLAPTLGGLWRSDGTGGGTSLVHACQVDPYGFTNNLVDADGTLLFRVETPDGEHIELWRSDGTGPGTEAVAEVFGQLFFRFTVVGGSLFFTQFGGDETGDELFIYLANCGDGVLGTGELCDNGAMNGIDGICTTACILVNDVDGDGVLNAADNCPNDWNAGQEDTDGDDEGDGCEACVGGGAVTKGLLKIAKLDTPLPDDKLTLKGFMTVPTTPYIGPDVKGAIIRIEDSTGTDVLHAEVPGLFYDPAFGDGWKTNSSYTSFKYMNKNPGGFQGITKVVIKLDPDTGIVKFTVKGKDGSFAFDTMNLPLTGTVALDTEKPVVAQCGVATFPNPPGTPGSCTLKPTGASVKCK